MSTHKPDTELIDRLKSVSTATIANVLLSYGYRNVVLTGVTPLSTKHASVAGPAYTLRFIPSREDIDSMDVYSNTDNLHRRAIEECPPDAVLVIDAGRSSKASSAGDVMAARLKIRGVAGIVTDGGFRDSSGINATGLPAYQVATATPATPIALHPIQLDGAIGCAGVAIYPGDIIVGDADGVVAIPAHIAQEVSIKAWEAAQYEEFVDHMVAKGHPIFGLFPATAESRAEFETWVAAGKPNN